MSTLYALFTNLEEAGDALAAIAKTQLGECDAKVVSNGSEVSGDGLVLKSVSNPVSEMVGQVGPRARPTPNEKSESSGDTTAFLKKSLDKGGRIVVVALAESAYEDRATSVLEMHNAVAIAATRA